MFRLPLSSFPPFPFNEVCEKTTRKVFIKQDISVIEQTLILSFLYLDTADSKALFAPLKPAAERGGDSSAPLVFLPLASWANERPASCPFAFGKRKKSAGAKFGEKGGSAISGMALAASQFLAAATFMTGVLFQPQISVKNGPDQIRSDQISQG